MDRHLLYVYEVHWSHSRGYRVVVPIKRSDGNIRKIHRTFLTKKLGISLAEAKSRAIAERNRLMKIHGVHGPGRRRHKPKLKPPKRLFGVYRVQENDSGRLSWHWRAFWSVNYHMFGVSYSEKAHLPGVARQKAINKRLEAEAKYPGLRKSRGYRIRNGS
jgi:hypothetical protein